MPVFNEATGITDVLDDIVRYVFDLVPDAELVVVDDRSTDETASIVSAFATVDPRVRVLTNDVNVGHGPSVRRGIDATAGEWILHIDSDGQIELAEFGSLWSRRCDSDLVLGVRSRRHDPLHRLVLTRITRVLVSALAGTWVPDANTPFKLVRRSLFDHLAPAIPATSFAPSILLVLGARRVEATTTEVNITHLPRRYGTSTLRLGRLASAVARSTLQTVAFRRRRLDPFVRESVR